MWLNIARNTPVGKLWQIREITVEHQGLIYFSKNLLLLRGTRVVFLKEEQEHSWDDRLA